MSDTAWVIGLIINLISVFAVVIQTRVSLERRIAILETYMKILLRDRGVSIRQSDKLHDIREEDIPRYDRKGDL